MRSRRGRLPGGSPEALDVLERDHEFLLKGGVFTQSLISAWLGFKRAEWRLLNEWPQPLELAAYNDI